jgi:hypothetical protein
MAPPTTDELAGVYFYIEAEEKVYVPPTPLTDSPPAPESAGPSSH